MASGAIRNNDLDSLTRGFEIVGYTREEVEEKFKSIFTAFQYGCPPHGGMAPGIDRLIMLIQDEPNLREVQAFPTSASGQDLMMGSPSELTDKQLEELGITIKKDGKDWKKEGSATDTYSVNYGMCIYNLTIGNDTIGSVYGETVRRHELVKKLMEV